MWRPGAGALERGGDLEIPGSACVTRRCKNRSICEYKSLTRGRSPERVTPPMFKPDEYQTLSMRRESLDMTFELYPIRISA